MPDSDLMFRPASELARMVRAGEVSARELVEISLARIAELVWKGEGLTTASRDAARKMLHAVPGQIRDAVPAGISVASKTGTLDAVRAAAAVVELPGRPFALSVMTTYLANDADGERAIHDIAAAAFSYFSRLAAGGIYGRKQP